MCFYWRNTNLPQNFSQINARVIFFLFLSQRSDSRVWVCTYTWTAVTPTYWSNSTRNCQVTKHVLAAVPLTLKRDNFKNKFKKRCLIEKNNIANTTQRMFIEKVEKLWLIIHVFFLHYNFDDCVPALPVRLTADWMLVTYHLWYCKCFLITGVLWQLNDRVPITLVLTSFRYFTFKYAFLFYFFHSYSNSTIRSCFCCKKSYECVYLNHFFLLINTQDLRFQCFPKKHLL